MYCLALAFLRFDTCVPEDVSTRMSTRASAISPYFLSIKYDLQKYRLDQLSRYKPRSVECQMFGPARFIFLFHQARSAYSGAARPGSRAVFCYAVTTIVTTTRRQIHELFKTYIRF